MKTRLNQIILGAFLILFLMSGNVVAEGTEVSVVSGLENVVEPKLELEDWMINESYWNLSKNSYMVENEKDNILQVEDWMMDNNRWELPVLKFRIVENDPVLNIEDWMVNKLYWN